MSSIFSRLGGLSLPAAAAAARPPESVPEEHSEDEADSSRRLPLKKEEVCDDHKRRLVIGACVESSRPVLDWFDERQTRHFVHNYSDLEKWCEALRSAYLEWRTGGELFVFFGKERIEFDEDDHGMVNVLMLTRPRKSEESSSVIYCDRPFAFAECRAAVPTRAALRRRVKSVDLLREDERECCHVAHFEGILFPGAISYLSRESLAVRPEQFR